MANRRKISHQHRHRKLINEQGWDEVMYINKYAMFMGYLSMAIKGLCFLILTWTTVVLLGGFVSLLQKKDFWCLTFITLVQTAGVFDVVLNEKLSQVWDSFKGLANSVALGGKLPQNNLGVFFVMIQMLVVLILLCPLVAIYVFGLLISTGISIWRLIKHDYGRNSVDEPNLKPALDTLYYLALVQGVLFCYRFLHDRTQMTLAKEVIRNCDDKGGLEIVSKYMGETRIGCEKDPSSARGRNLITYGVDLIGSKSPDDCLSGVQMLYIAIRIMERGLKNARKIIAWGRNNIEECIRNRKRSWVLAKHHWAAPTPDETSHRVCSTSSPLLHKLVEMLNPRGAYDKEMRNHAARIVAYLARDIHLEEFPRAIQYISMLIGMTFEEYRLIDPYTLLYKYDQDCDQQAYEKLVLRGFCILRKLANDDDNCRIMSHTQGLLPRIMAPLTSDIIHQFSGGAWSISVVEGSLKVMRLLVASSGDTGAKLRREISNNKQAIGTMERILSCDSCCAKLQKQAMGVLIQLYTDNDKNQDRAAFIKMLLVDIFFSGNSKHRSIRKLAGEALVKLCIQGRSNTSIILQVSNGVVDNLTKILLLDDAENKTCRIRAAEILEHMCIHHTQDDDSRHKLKEAMTDTMPKVLAQLLSRGPTEDQTHPRIEEDQVVVTEKEDIENQFKHPQENSRKKTSSSSHPQKNKDDDDDVQVEEEVHQLEDYEDDNLHAPLLSLCVTICNTFISVDQDLTGQLNAINLPRKLKDMVAENSIPTVPCLRLMKLTCKMVISMMKHRDNYLKEDLESLTEALSSAAESMSLLDISMVFASEDDDAETTMKHVRSLGSLVKEAKESVDAYCNARESGNIEPFTSTDG